MAKKAARSKSADDSGQSVGDARVVAIVGPELFLHAEHARRIKDAIAQRHGESDAVRFDGESADAAGVLDECRTFGLMITHKLVIVDSADKFVNAGTRAMLERYAADPSPSATLVLRSINTWIPGKLGEAIQGSGGYFKCESPKEADLPAFIAERARSAHGVEVEPEGAGILIERLGTDMAKIDRELAKLAAGLPLAGSDGSARPIVTAKHVRAMVGLSREDEVWGVQADLLSGSPELALRRVRELIHVSRQPTTLVSYACVDLGKKLSVLSRAMAGGLNPFQAAGRAKVWGSSRDAMLSAAKRLGPGGTATVLREAVRADANQKTGVGDPQRTLELMALRLGSIAAR
jgi:DNA polymerase III delta subunit